MSKLLTRSIFTIILLMGLSACGGGGGLSGDDDSGGTGGNADTDTDTGAVIETFVFKLGSYSGLNFTDETLDVGVTSLSAGGSTSVSAYLVDENNIPVTSSSTTQMTFTSTCASQGTASITSPVTITDGRATATYQASGCIGTDTITVRAIVITEITDDQVTAYETLTATGTISVAGSAVGSIAFISATPEIIALSGTGGAGRSETSTIIFKVLNEAGGAVANADIVFSLNSMIGGLSINPTEATTDQEGIVQTIVSSGSVPTSVRVTATVTSTAISTQSDQLTIESGAPDQDSFSISASILNPQSWETDGVPITFTARLADHFNNPAPDGTAVSFITEGGAIIGSCSTTDGACTTTWTSQDPRPANGRVTILAYAIGEESFTDVNGDGKFGLYDSDSDGTADTLEPFTDLSEAWRDDDEDNCRDIASASTCTAGDTTTIEEFLDFGGGANGIPNGIFDTPNSSTADGTPEGDGIYNGALCGDTSCADAPKSLHVRKPIVLVMSGATPVYTNTSISATSNGCILVTENTPATVTFTITDERLQQMPRGTRVTATSSGSLIKHTLLSGFTAWPNTNSAGVATFTAQINGTLDDESTGWFQVKIETPGPDQNYNATGDGTEATFSTCIILEKN